MDGAPLLDILAPDANEEFLAQAEGQIRAYGKLVVAGIVDIGRKLVEVKDRRLPRPIHRLRHRAAGLVRTCGAQFRLGLRNVQSGKLCRFGRPDDRRLVAVPDRRAVDISPARIAPRTSPTKPPRGDHAMTITARNQRQRPELRKADGRRLPIGAP